MDFIINILSTPAILVGLISLIGLTLQKKPIEDIVKGTLKTIVGFLVLTAGSNFLQTGSLNDFGTIFNYAFNMQGVVPNNEAIVSLGLEKFARYGIHYVYWNDCQYCHGKIFQTSLHIPDRTSYVVYGMYAGGYFKCRTVKRPSAMDRRRLGTGIDHGIISGNLSADNV